MLAGLVTAGLAAVACAKPWIGSSGGGGDASLTALDAGTRFPLASAVSLVLLAAWGSCSSPAASYDVPSRSWRPWQPLVWWRP